MERRLAAILAADVVGYSRMMERDEVGTLGAVRERRRELIAPTIERFDGRIVKLMGDGLLAEFSSVVNAVHAAIDIQRAMAERNATRPAEAAVRFRIGVNLGDIIVEEGDVYGDGVNVAARLEQLASPGGVCISRSVRDQIRDKLALTLTDLGDVSVKNILRPVRAFELALSGDLARTTAERPPDPARSAEIASANLRAQHPMIADLAYGGYVRPVYGYYEGHYLCVRPAFSDPARYVVYPMTIEWSDSEGALRFSDRNPGFEQRGIITIPTGASYIHFVTLEAGSVRLITAHHMPETHTRTLGLMLTLANPKGRMLTPAAAPIVIERTDRNPLPYAGLVGLVARNDPRLATFPHELLAVPSAPLILDTTTGDAGLADPARPKSSR
jgi:class 3 adenylate cyclase